VLLQLGTQASIPSAFGGDSFRQWIGIPDEARDGRSHLGILVLGWSYIISARLVEIQGDSAEMRYTNLKVPGYVQDSENGHTSHVIDIGKVDEDMTRW
jgi:hypothetical protein